MGDEGSDERANWFKERVEQMQEESQSADGGSDVGLPEPLAALLRARGMGAMLAGQRRSGAKVKTPELSVFQDAINKNINLKWDPRMEEFALREGSVVESDPSDGTTMVKFENVGTSGTKALWIPSEILVEVQ